MSADNWTICPDCVKRSEALKEGFIKKYYGKLDSFVYNKILEEIDKAVEHIESESSDEHEPSQEILELMDEKKIEVNFEGDSYYGGQILQQGQISVGLREDYGQGVDEEGYVYFDYSGKCDCGFDKSIRFNQKTDKIIKKECV